MEKAGLSPLVVFTGDESRQLQHAMAGCWRGPSSGYEPVLTGAGRLRSLVPEDIILLDSTGTAWTDNGSGPAMNFTEALQSAQRALDKAVSSSAVNICALRPDIGRIIPVTCFEDAAVERAFLAAEDLVRRKRRALVETTHLLYGLLAARGPTVCRLCEQANLELDTLCSKLSLAIREDTHFGPLRRTSNFLDCQRLAQELAWNVGSPIVREPHLLWAVFKKAEHSPPLQHACMKLGLDTKRLLQLIESQYPHPPRPDSIQLCSTNPPDQNGM